MKKLVAYVTSSLPDREFTKELIYNLKDSGVDSIELGVPFSDPVADGEIIELANQKSLLAGFKLDDIFNISNEVAKDIDLLIMGYFNSFYRRGVEFFLKEAQKSKVSGFIIPDLPYEEAREYKPLFREYKKALIDFVAPTDSKERIASVVRESEKFIYLVAYAGITGSRKSEDLNSVISYIRECTKTPIYVGFGVNEQSAKSKSKGVDGVIVGSSFVKTLLDESLTNSEKIAKISSSAKIIKSEINS